MGIFLVGLGQLTEAGQDNMALHTQNVLMILTHNRLDCLRLCLEMLEKGRAFEAFDRVVFLLNGVPIKLKSYVESFCGVRPDIKWDFVEGPGTRPEGICYVQNECLKRYPGCFYVKVDEDVFVPAGWAERMIETYQHYNARTDLALITPLIPNNAYGLHRLLTVFYSNELAEFRDIYSANPSQNPKGPTWLRPDIGQWASRKFLDLETANRRQRSHVKPEGSIGRYHEFCKYFSIGCIGYDYRHVERMGGCLPPRDEPDWCGWIEDNEQLCVLDQSMIVLHYAFFVQQMYLDRSSLLEDIRVANLPDTLKRESLAYHFPRWDRLIRQLPGMVGRRMKRRG